MMPFKVIYEEFPAEAQGIYGAVQKRKTGYLILINSLLTDEQKKSTLCHELAHIVLDHFANIPEDADQCFFCGLDTQEAEADQYAANMTETEFEALMQLAI